MKATLTLFFTLVLSVAWTQIELNTTAFLTDNQGNGASGVPVLFTVQAAGAVYSAEQVTDASGEATVGIELPTGTMQGMVNATYMNCDSVEVSMSGSFSANALGGLSDVYLTGIYCGGNTGGEDCNMSLDGGLTVLGSWMFMVSGAPDDAVYDWSIDGATMENSNSPQFGWQFDGESVWTVCVYVTSDSCEPWTDCYVVDTTDPTGGGDCELSFEIVQSVDEAGNFIPGSLDVIVPELEGQPSYYWDFGDEGTSTEASPSHTYAGNGPYVLCLTATWGLNAICTATYCDSVSVDDEGMINFMEGFTINVVLEGSANAIDDLSTGFNLNPYPNPVVAGDEVRWSFSNDFVGRLEVFNPAGQLHVSLPMNSNQSVSTKGWAPGMYVLKWVGMDGVASSSRLFVQ